MELKKIKNIHFIGVKGVGMAPLAIIAKEAGFTVTGCDIADTFITDQLLQKAGIEPVVGFHRDHITNVDLVITTGAHGGKNNPEVQFAQTQHVPILMQGQAVGEFMKGDIFGRKLQGISVAGCHGKTTTTAMIATIFGEAKLDPSYIIGTGDIASLDGPGHYGKGKYFIAEADEYATDIYHEKTPKFLWQYPKHLVITNIEFDHPDVYKNIEDVQEAYQNLTKNIQQNGIFIANGDDMYSRKIIENYNRNKITFGYNSYNDYIVSNIQIQDNQTYFTLEDTIDGLVEDFKLQIIGRHNVLNAVAAIIVAKNAGVETAQIEKGLLAFQGTKRRFEYKGPLVSGAELYDDYAHHPTEIKATLHALREFHPDKKIICIFQPHTYSRTKLLFEEFSSSFDDAETVLIADIYASQREQIDPAVSSQQLVEAIEIRGIDAHFVPTIPNVVKYIRENQFDSNYCIITMGAGDIYTIENLLIKEKLL